MRTIWPVLLLVCLGGCTAYQPVAWHGRGSWAEARAAANARTEMPADLERFVNDSGQRSTAGGTAAGAGRHLVRSGETLSGVAQRYGTSLSALAKTNGVKAPYKVHAGQVLRIPPSAKRPPRPTLVAARPAPPIVVVQAPRAPAPTQPIRVAALAPVAVTAEIVPASPPPMSPHELEATRHAAQQRPPALSGDGFLWPVRGPITSAFGPKPNGARNDGINIRAAEGTPVAAAENGVVVYAGEEIPGYGRMLLISHADGLTTAYAHNARLLVAVGAVVDRGQQVATVGRTGNVTSPQLHFELRDGKDPIDPVSHLDNARTRIASAR